MGARLLEYQVQRGFESVPRSAQGSGQCTGHESQLPCYRFRQRIPNINLQQARDLDQEKRLDLLGSPCPGGLRMSPCRAPRMQSCRGWGGSPGGPVDPGYLEMTDSGRRAHRDCLAPGLQQLTSCHHESTVDYVSSWRGPAALAKRISLDCGVSTGWSYLQPSVVCMTLLSAATVAAFGSRVVHAKILSGIQPGQLQKNDSLQRARARALGPTLAEHLRELGALGLAIPVLFSGPVVLPILKGGGPQGAKGGVRLVCAQAHVQWRLRVVPILPRGTIA